MTKHKTTLTAEPSHIINAMLDLCDEWENVANEYRERAEKSTSADGKPNPEVCRSIAVGLEQCARDVKKIIGKRSEPPDANEPAPTTVRST